MSGKELVGSSPPKHLESPTDSQATVELKQVFYVQPYHVIKEKYHSRPVKWGISDIISLPSHPTPALKFYKGISYIFL